MLEKWGRLRALQNLVLNEVRALPAQGDLELLCWLCREPGSVGMTCHVIQECFNQHLFTLSKEMERYLGISHSIVQKKALPPKMLSSEIVQNFVMETKCIRRGASASPARTPRRPHLVHGQEPQAQVLGGS